MNRRAHPSRFLLLALLGVMACASTPAEPQNPAWADVAPIFRGECNGCHGWNAGQTGGGYRFDFFDVTESVCGRAARAHGTELALAGSPLGPDGLPVAAAKIEADVVTQKGATWPRMPPQPSPALPAWERDTIERWAARPVKGPAPADNRPPTISVFGYPANAGPTLTFTAVIDDPDGDSALGVIEANGIAAFLMNRPGSFDVSFDTTTWPAGSQPLTAVLCDGWTSTTVDLGAVQIIH